MLIFLFEARLTNPLTWVVTRSMNSTSFRAIEAARDEEEAESDEEVEEDTDAAGDGDG